MNNLLLINFLLKRKSKIKIYILFRYQYLLYAHSFNLSDISNEIYNKNEQNDSEEKKFALFLREFII